MKRLLGEDPFSLTREELNELEVAFLEERKRLEASPIKQ
jgi:hypothetical protein